MPQYIEIDLDLFGRNGKARNVALTLSGDKEVRLEREGTRYHIHLPARTLAVLF